MNEQIRQLAEQALQLVADEHTDGDESRLNTDSYHVKDLIQEKFAELIIEECRTVVSDVYRKTPLELCGPLLTADQEIAIHFYGVKE